MGEDVNFPITFGHEKIKNNVYNAIDDSMKNRKHLWNLYNEQNTFYCGKGFFRLLLTMLYITKNWLNCLLKPLWETQNGSSIAQLQKKTF